MEIVCKVVEQKWSLLLFRAVVLVFAEWENESLLKHADSLIWFFEITSCYTLKVIADI